MDGFSFYILLYQIIIINRLYSFVWSLNKLQLYLCHTFIIIQYDLVHNRQNNFNYSINNKISAQVHTYVNKL